MKLGKPTLITITAPTCAGKSHLVTELLKQGFVGIVGTTTRAPRPGEIDGRDYHFLTREQSSDWEEKGLFAELITFNGNQYGVTKKEMAKKMSGEQTPLLILEPKGLLIYEKLCIEEGWNMFSIFLSTPEDVRIQRLNDRTADEIFQGASTTLSLNKVISAHTKRVMSLARDEWDWGERYPWDVVLPGDDLEKAIALFRSVFTSRISI